MRNHLRRYQGNKRADCHRVALPLNLLLNEGTLIEDFESSADWTPTNGTAEDNTIEYKSGEKSVKLVTGVAATETAVKTVSFDFTSMQQLRMWYYDHDNLNIGGHMHTHFSDQTGMSRYYRIYTLNGIAGKTGGWHYLAYPKNWFVAIGGTPSWSSIIRMRLQLQATTGVTHSASYDTLYSGVVGVPFVMLCFDDAYNSWINDVVPYMQRQNMRGTLFVRTSVPNAGTTVTYAQLRAVAALGWTIGNHTRDHNSLGGQSLATQESYISAGKSDLDANGLSADSNFFAYPAGSYDTTSLTACANQGVLLARTTNGCDRQQSNPNPPVILPYSLGAYELGCTPIGTSVALATAKAMIDDAITGGVGISMLFHDVGAASNWTLADFQALVDYIATKAKAGLIYPLTYREYYNLATGATKVVKP